MARFLYSDGVVKAANDALAPDGALLDLTARSIAEARASAEAQEGFAAFLEKRKPTWAR